MEELDLDMMKFVRANSAQRERVWQQADTLNAKKSIEDLDRLQRFYQKSIQDNKNSKKQEIHGETYKRKNVLKYTIISTVTFATFLLASKAVKIGYEISEYNRILNQKIESELSEKELELYNAEHKDFISNIIESYEQINDAKANLDSNSYDRQGNNITNSWKEYDFDGSSLLNLSEFQQDAIDSATNNVIEEYQERGK